MKRIVHNMLADQDLSLVDTLPPSPTRSEYSGTIPSKVFISIGTPQLEVQNIFYSKPESQKPESDMRKPPTPKISIEEIKQHLDNLLKREFHEVALDNITKYYSPEEDKEEILVFIKVEKHPYRVIKNIYRKLQKEKPEIADAIVLLPSFR